jgi:uncharacterized phosphosugar-binding protein
MHTYLDRIAGVLAAIDKTQGEPIARAAGHMADSIAAGRAVYLFGSGHSILPVMDIFPRYGSFPGFVSIIDPRLLWYGAVGPGGARELLWIERHEGYIENLFKSFHFTPQDTMVIFSHGGLNAAPVEAALYSKARGLFVVAVTCGANQREAAATHSSGKKLADIADVVIDNCVPREDALVRIDGWPHPVGAGSTVAVVAVAMMVLTEVARRLSARGVTLPVFVSPNVQPDMQHNGQVFQAHADLVRRL